MQIRRNTKTFKTILEIVTACQARPDRADLIRLYITKAGKSINDRISVEGSQGEAEFFYNLNYQAVLNNLSSSTHQLYQSDETPGIYFFHSLSKEWDETPFEFDTKVKTEFASLPELPNVREKGASKEFKIPVEAEKTGAGRARKETKETKQEPAVVKTPTMFVSKGPKQPDYNLKHTFQFTDLDRIVFRNAKLNKRDVLDHYNRISEYILPYLKDRPHFVRQQSDRGPYPQRANVDSLPKKVLHEIPDWLQTTSVEGDEMFLCNDKEHLLLYVELGCVQFDPCQATKKSPDTPDQMVIGIEGGSDFSKAIDAAQTLHGVLAGLKLTSHIKTDGLSGFHVYLALDSKSKYETTMSVAEYICKLVRLKSPAHVALKGEEDSAYGKVVFDPYLNSASVGLVAPYSLVAGTPALIATPILWDEVDENLRIEDFNYETIFGRLKKVGDPFEDLGKKKINAGTLLQKLEENYSFLVNP